METEENGSAPLSAMEVLQELSQEAVRLATEAWVRRWNPPPVDTPAVEPPTRHRRVQSEILTSNSSSSSMGNSQILRFGSHDDGEYSSFDPEMLANQKRQWYQINSKTLETDIYEDPTKLFEHFVIVGLHPESKLEFVEDAYIRGKKFDQRMKQADINDPKMQQHRQPKFPTMDPQVLFMYPPRKKMAMHSRDLAAFCFPSGVEARILERSPSLSELNELVYGQEHLCRDDLSFIFSLKVAGNATLYGVCLQFQEVVQRPPAIYGGHSPLPQSHSGSSRFLVSAPRCYCILTRVPLFQLHYEMLNSMISQERLNRITKFVADMSLVSSVDSQPISKNHLTDNSPRPKSGRDWMAAAIPVDHAVTLAAAAAGIISDEEASSMCANSCGNAIASDASDQCLMTDSNKDGSTNIDAYDDSTSENCENQSEESFRNLASLLSPARFTTLDDDSISQDEDPSDDMIMKWAKETKNDLLQIVCGYHCLDLPERGSKITFQPLEHMQAIECRRPSVSELGSEKYIQHILKESEDESQVKWKLAFLEEASSVCLWSTATTCRFLSLDNILALIAGVLLEKQVIVICPNMGVLSAVVLSTIPLIRPFEWQSLFLPILPVRMVDFLDAPVPFVVGMKHKVADLKTGVANLVQVNVLTNEVKSCNLPRLPQQKDLICELRPIHSKLSCNNSAATKHPVHKYDEVQAAAAVEFLTVLRRYLESLCTDLRLHTITSVQSNTEKVSLLLKDSFIYSFPTKDQPFVKLFVETQMFSVLSDYRLMNIENE